MDSSDLQRSISRSSTYIPTLSIPSLPLHSSDFDISMTVIWGFDLSKMRWGAFRHTEMYSKKWYMRRKRFIFYQLAMNVCLAAECAATYSLSKYEDLQRHVGEYTNNAAKVHNNDIIAAQCLTIVFCVLVATLFGADLFFLVFWPERKYPKWYNIARISCGLFIFMGLWAAALASTVIVAAHVADFTGVDEQRKQEILRIYFRPPLIYRHWPTNIVYVVLLWLGLVFTGCAFVAMYLGVRYEGNLGTGSRTVRPLAGYDNAPLQSDKDTPASSSEIRRTPNSIDDV